MTPLQRLQDLLRDLLQLDLSDLDFGIYRLLRVKRAEIDRFLEVQLPEAVAEAFGAAAAAERTALEEELAALTGRIRTEVAEDALDATGGVAEEYRDVKVAAARELLADYETARARLARVRTSDEQRIEVFNHLHEFFRRYYEDGDFVPKRHYGRRERYAVPYDGEEVLLHWANRGQHYVKNAEVFKDYAFTVEGDLLAEPARVRFILTEASVSPGDTKGDSRYFFPRPDDVAWDADARTLTIPFEYRLPTKEEDDGFGRVRIQETILENHLDALVEAIPDGALRGALAPGDDGNGDDEEQAPLLRHLRRFVRRNTSDYFVHRDLQGFLEHELEFYLKDQVLHLADLEGDTTARLRMIKVLRKVAGQVITFLAQVEEVQKRLFEKRKFVLRTDYLVLMKAVPEELRTEVLANQEQIDEWKRLFHIDPKKDLFNPEGAVSEAFLESRPTLVVNTALFEDDFRDRLLESFEDIEEATGGILVHSENYQALRLLEPRFRGQIKCIYIDPPYNTGSDDFLYKDRYQHSSWLAMMEERLRLGREMLAERGALFVSLDDNEQPNLRSSADSVFGAENFIDTVIWQKVYAPKNTARHFSASHDFIVVYARAGHEWTPNLLPRSEEADARYGNRDDDPRGDWKADNLLARNYYSRGEYEVESPSGKEFSNPRGTYWRVSKDKFEKLDADDRIWWGEDGGNMPAIKRFLSEVKEGIVSQTIWEYGDVGHTQEAKRELLAILDFPRTEDVLQTVKPTRLVRRIVRLGSDPGDWVVDFFAGSGTTGHAVLNHNREEDEGNRRFILVEQGGYFDRMLVDRVVRALYTSGWNNQQPTIDDQGEPGLHPLYKILRLESYEDALHNLASEEALDREAPRAAALRNAQGEDHYRLHYLASLSLQASDTMLNVQKLEHPFRYEMEILTDEGPERRTVDLVETFNLILGMRVRRLERWVNEDDGDGRSYRAVVGEDPEGQHTLILWRDMDGLDPALEREFLEARIADTEGPPFDLILINGDSTVPGVRSLDPLFKAGLEAGTT